MIKSISQESGERVLTGGANARCGHCQSAVLGTQGWSLLPESHLFAPLRKRNPPFPNQNLSGAKAGRSQTVLT